MARVRPGGPRRQPDRHTAAPNPFGQQATSDAGYGGGGRRWNWQMPAGLPVSAQSTPERTVAFSTTILDSIIPFVYGVRKVTGLCCGKNLAGQIASLAYLFCYGEQESVDNLRINGELASGLPWVSSITYRYGTGAETIPAGFTAFGDNDDWAKYCYVTFIINTLNADVPGSFDVTAELGGQHVYDFRATTTGPSSNPALIAYDILTNANWKGLSSTKIDTDQWEAFADWCDDVMGDTSKRFEFNGIIYQRDPEAAVAEVLGHAFASLYFGADGKLKIWSEMDPPAITGEWSAAASATITEDGTAGDATNEVEAGDILYVGSTVRTVVSVTDDDTIVLDSALTVSGVTVRKTSGVYLRRENWVRLPTGRNIAPGSVPDVVIVSHTQNDDWGSYRYPAPGDVTGDKRMEITANGCTSASMARRISEMKKNLLVYEPFLWSGVADGVAAGLEPGDIAFFDDDVLTMQAVRVLPPVTWETAGHYGLELREYDPSSLSTSTEPNNTPPSVTPGWVTDDPDAPTAATQTFGEAGNWDQASLLPDPDDLTTAQGWSNGAGVSSSYSGANDWTTFTVSTPATATADYALGSLNCLTLVTCLVKTSATGFNLQFIDTNLSATVGNHSIPGDGLWHRVSVVVQAGNANSIRVAGISAAASDELIVRRMRAVCWDDNPALKLYERWGWTEHGSASSSVAKYRMTDGDDLAIVLDEVPQGAVTLEHVMLVVGISGQTTQWGTGATVEATMYAVGNNGGVVAFPAPTQAIEARIFGQALDTMRANDLIESARIGDITNGDYTEISTAGLVTLVGDATVWEDLRFPVGLVSRLGNADPDWVKIQDNGSSSIGVYGLGFASNIDQEVYLAVQFPHAWKEASSIIPHVHWTPLIASEGGDEGVVWALEYTWANIGIVDGSGSPVTFGTTTTILAPDVDTFTAKEHRMVNFDPITATSKTYSSMLLCRLYRDVSDADDDYASDAVLLEFDIHYEIDSLGSNTVESKT